MAGIGSSDRYLGFVLPFFDALRRIGTSAAKVGVNVVESFGPRIAVPVVEINVDALNAESTPKVWIAVFALSALVNSIVNIFGTDEVGIFEMHPERFTTVPLLFAICHIAYPRLRVVMLFAFVPFPVVLTSKTF